MIELPNLEDAYLHENNFYLSTQPGRIGKLLAHAELYQRILEVPGDIVECGIFKGASFMRLAYFRNLYESKHSRKLIGFDIFGTFPDSDYPDDAEKLSKFKQDAGTESISKEQLFKLLKAKGCEDNLELIEGDILKTVPKFIENKPENKIALLHADVDIYKPTLCILENLYKNLSKNGIMILDDYGIFPGATKAVDQFFENESIEIKKFPYAYAPAYIIKS